MVDVSDKPVTARRAVAEASVAVSPETMSMVIDGGGSKGDVLGVAELAGVMGGKRTSDLIPLCHPLALTDLVVAITPDRAAGVLRIRAEAATTGQTGVEMEAMTAASVAALTVYDMVKGVERGVEIRGVRLVSKTGGKCGTWVRHGATDREAAPHAGPRPGARVAGRVGPKQKGRGVSADERHAPDGRTTALVITASDGAAAGVREDTSGARVAERLAALGFAVERRSCPTTRRRSRPPSSRARRHHALVVTTGGTGLTPRDVTPQATAAVVDYEVPGLAEAMRAAGRATTPLADLSRGVVGVRGGRSSSTCRAARRARSNRSRRSCPCSTTPSRRSPGRTITGARPSSIDDGGPPR